jgi:peptidoglycan lytic transglycosylase D
MSGEMKMNVQRVVMLWVAIFVLSTSALSVGAQTIYKDMSQSEQLAFVAAQARRIALEMSGSNYEFTPAFEKDIQAAVRQYTQRISNSGDASAKTDLRVVMERGQAMAPALISAFRTRNVSPLFGLYLPWIESEYQNLQASGPSGAVGVFQLIPSTGKRYGLSEQELLDVTKSADAAARYIADSLNAFMSDPMKEALALLAYNRGVPRTTRDLTILRDDRNKGCSICALTADRSKLDETFRSESVFYVPRFFAAAIIGENPTAFGLNVRPLSSN